MQNIIGGTANVANSTLFGNSAVLEGGAILNRLGQADLRTSIVWGNAPDQILSIDGGETLADFSNIEGGWPGASNLNADPLFVPGPGGCFYLSQSSSGAPVDSPCIDAGSDTAVTAGLSGLTTSQVETLDTGVVDIGFHYRITDRPFTLGDYDRDGAITLADYSDWSTCGTGPAIAVPSVCCRVFDIETDDDVDLADFARFSASLSSGFGEAGSSSGSGAAGVDRVSRAIRVAGEK